MRRFHLLRGLGRAPLGIVLYLAVTGGATALATTGSSTASTSGATATVVRYAAPNGASTGNCTATSPCSLTQALTGGSNGTQVSLASGTYQLSSPISIPGGVSVVGQLGAAMPVIQASASINNDAVTVNSSSSISEVKIVDPAPDSDAVYLNGGRGSDLILETSGPATGHADHPPAAADISSSPAGALLSDSLAYSTGPGTDGVLMRGGGGGQSAALVNVTAIATGSGADGVQSTLTTPGSLVNVIAQGANKAIAAQLVGPSSSAAPVLSVSHSDFSPSSASGYVDAGGNVFAAPLFASLQAGDFHELPGSPTIDAGTPSTQSTGVDPDGVSRSLTDTPDIGAYELVGSGDETTAPDPAGTSPTSTAPGAPTSSQGGASTSAVVVGRTFSAGPVSGHIEVRLPGASSSIPLTSGQSLPVGTIVNAADGVVSLTSAKNDAGTLQTANLWGGRFRMEQKAGANPVTRLVLVGALGGCKARATAKPSLASAATARSTHAKPRTRQLWGKDNHGNFSTRGVNSVATVRGTQWLTKDTCRGTITRVMRGIVAVRNVHTGRTRLVHAGQSYLVRGVVR